MNGKKGEEKATARPEPAARVRRDCVAPSSSAPAPPRSPLAGLNTRNPDDVHVRCTTDVQCFVHVIITSNVTSRPEITKRLMKFWKIILRNVNEHVDEMLTICFLFIRSA